MRVEERKAGGGVGGFGDQWAGEGDGLLNGLDRILWSQQQHPEQLF